MSEGPNLCITITIHNLKGYKKKVRPITGNEDLGGINVMPRLLWTVGKILPQQGFELPTVQLAASRYND